MNIIVNEISKRHNRKLNGRVKLHLRKENGTVITNKIMKMACSNHADNKWLMIMSRVFAS
jgi:hypothetical protein